MKTPLMIASVIFAAIVAAYFFSRSNSGGDAIAPQSSLAALGARHTAFAAAFYENASADSGAIVFSDPNRGHLAVALTDLNEVRIVNTDKGPTLDDVFFLFVTKSGQKALVSNTIENFASVLQLIQTLPEFDNAGVVTAMGVTDNRETVVWKGMK